MSFVFSGKSSWNNKAFIRATPIDMYRTWRPQAWSSIKDDYLSVSAFMDDENEFDNISEPEEIAISEPFVVPEEQNSDDLPETGLNLGAGGSSIVYTSNTELKELINQVKTTVQKIDEENSQLVDLKKKIKDCFRCVICLENCVGPFTFCTSCSQFVGCYNCVINVEICPLCRAAFSNVCNHCNENVEIPRNGLRMEELFRLLSPSSVATE